MSHQRTFHFEWADAVTGALDYVVCTTDKPKVAVLVFPGNIAGVINTIVPSFVSAFRIPVVFFEKSKRFTFAGADYNLSLLTRFNRAAFMVDQVYIILRIRKPHASRFRFHPRHGGDGKGCFCLSETFHQFDTRQFLESFKYSGVQCFSGNGAVF